MNKTVLITGASKGIGYYTAKLFGEKGWNVALSYNNTPEPALNLAEELCRSGIKAVAIKADMSKSEDISNLFKVAIAELGSLDAVVNNAGIAQQKLFTDLTDFDIDNMLNVNLKSVILCCREAAKHMVQNQFGAIVNISSIFGISGGSCEVHYSAAKAGVIGLTKALAAELGLSGVRVNCVAPGAVDTPMNSHLAKETVDMICDETPLARMGKPQEIAQAIYFLCDDEMSSFITGQVISPNGGSIR